MATAVYETVLEAARQLPPDERQRLIEELSTLDPASRPTMESVRPLDQPAPARSPLVVALEALDPIRPEALDAMERAIEEDCETIDPHDW